MQTIKDLCDMRITLRVIGEAQKPRTEQDEWQRNARSYRVRLDNKKTGEHMDIDFWQGIGIKTKPTASGVLDCLLSESQACDMDFPEWCREYGYDEDSRKAEKTYNQCCSLGVELKSLLGDEYEAFLYAERD